MFYQLGTKIVAGIKTHRYASLTAPFQILLRNGPEALIVTIEDAHTPGFNVSEQAHLLRGNFLLTAKVSDVGKSNVCNNANVWRRDPGKVADLTFIVRADLNNNVRMNVLQGRKCHRHAEVIIVASRTLKHRMLSLHYVSDHILGRRFPRTSRDGYNLGIVLTPQHAGKIEERTWRVRGFDHSYTSWNVHCLADQNT